MRAGDRAGARGPGGQLRWSGRRRVERWRRPDGRLRPVGRHQPDSVRPVGVQQRRVLLRLRLAHLRGPAAGDDQRLLRARLGLERDRPELDDDRHPDAARPGVLQRDPTRRRRRQGRLRAQPLEPDRGGGERNLSGPLVHRRHRDRVAGPALLAGRGQLLLSAPRRSGVVHGDLDRVEHGSPEHQRGRSRALRAEELHPRGEDRACQEPQVLGRQGHRPLWHHVRRRPHRTAAAQRARVRPG